MQFIDELTRLLRKQISLCSSLDRQIGKLKRENKNLLGELILLHNKIIHQDSHITLLEANNKHLSFMASLTKVRQSRKPRTPVLPAGADEMWGELPEQLRTLMGSVLGCAARGKYQSVVPLCKRAIVELKSIREDHPQVATLLNILALAHRGQGQYKLAAFYLEECGRIREGIFGCDHPCLAATWNNLALLMAKQKNYHQAELLFNRVLSIKEKTQVSTWAELGHLGLMCRHRGKFGEAEDYYVRAIDILGRGTPGAELIGVSNNLASLYLAMGVADRADLLYRSIFGQFGSEIFRELNRCLESTGKGEPPPRVSLEGLAEGVGDLGSGWCDIRPALGRIFANLAELCVVRGQTTYAQSFSAIADVLLSYL